MSTDHQAHLEQALRVPRDLARSSDDRVVAGVGGGLGASLGVDPTVLRLAFVVLTLANGVGVLLYLAAAISLPTRSTTAPDAEGVLEPTAERAIAVGMITLGLLVLFGQMGVLLPGHFTWAVALAALGFALVWARTDVADRTKGLLLRVIGGGILLVVGLALLFATGGVLSRIGQVGLAVVATSVGVMLLLGPWIVRLLRDLSSERRERIRSEERSEIAAHLHDSVLQTLALIQRADAPGRAKTLARRQERELRAWLYGDRAPADGDDVNGTLQSALDALVTDVEDRHDVEVDLVVVGDCAMEPRLDALVAALREAASNAAGHAGVDEVSLYVEVQPEGVEAFVRDRGAGFELDAVDPSRLGIRESIIGRMARHGGRAEVHTAPGEGTEVALHVGRAPDRDGKEAAR